MLRATLPTLALASLSAAVSAQNVFDVPIDGSQETPPVVTAASGTGHVELNVGTGAITISGTYANLSANVTALHIHGPAPVGVEGGIIFSLSHTGGTTGTFSGSTVFSPSQVTDVLCGLTYLNVHNASFPGGEIRGQVVAVASATPYGSNPAGSLAVVSGVPKTGTLFQVGVDDPTGTVAPGSIPFIAISLSQTSISLPGWGLGGPTGELLIDTNPPNPVFQFQGSPWMGAGPVVFNLPVPNQKNLIGQTFYMQGLLFDGTQPAGQQQKLTGALELYVGGP